MSSFTPSSLHLLPENPGIYKLIDTSDAVVYVGKAKQLKQRVRSYFKASHTDVKTQHLVAVVTRIDIIETRTEKEALILENQLIKSLKPRYNCLLKDDKTYPYIKVTIRDDFPRLLVVRDKKKDGARYYGPFPSMGSSRALRRLLLDVFKLRDCSIPITLTALQPKCLLLDIGKCCGPCVDKSVKADYDQMIDQLHLLLTGKSKSVIAHLTECMRQASGEHRYEKAAYYRDSIQKITHLSEKQRVCLSDSAHFLSWAFVENGSHYYALVMHVIDGKLLFQHGAYATKDTLDLSGDFFQRFIARHLRDPAHVAPMMLCLPEHQCFFDESVFSPAQLQVPQRGEKRAALTLAQSNAQLALDRVTLETMKKERVSPLVLIQKALHLSEVPELIFGFDVSHLQGSHIVASAVCFKQGRPFKSLYRRFLIRSVREKSNDPASMQEVVLRRLKSCLDEQALPDLIVVDGGKAQLNSALSALRSLQLVDQISIVALAKKQETLYLPNQAEPLQLSRSHTGLLLLQHVRDESHRFARNFQHKRRSQAALRSVLLTVPGMGEKRLEQLRRALTSLSDISRYSNTVLHQKTGLPVSLFDLIREHVCF